MDRGNKAGAKLAWKELDDSGLGTFMEKPAGRGTRYVSTVEPPNKGHFGSRHFVLYRETVLWWEFK